MVANFGASLAVESADGMVHRCALRQNLDTLVVGDRVVWQAGPEETGVVVALTPRRTLLARPDGSGGAKPLAANIDQVLVVTASIPLFSPELVDQYLVAAETTGIAPLIVFNKVDLLDGPGRRHIDTALAPYRAIGYPIIHASTVAQHGLDELLEALKGRTSVFAGQSGVGKSSLIKALLPREEIAVGEISATTGLGRHTTSAARLYHLPGGGNLIDSPGVREFGLWAVSRGELEDGFREFRPHLGHCRFRDCRHTSEPGCAILKALAEGAIAEQRYRSFQRLAAELEEAAGQFAR